jgi:predicted  nucleic acid-binding Zn-ribbon protein
MDERKVPATRQDVSELREGFREDLLAFEHRMEKQLAEAAAKVVTTVFQIAEALQSRVTDLERSEANLKHRMAMIEERLTELEKKLKLPPPERVQ